MKNSDEKKVINPVFIGNFDNFYTYLNDYVKNKVPYLTKQYKKGTCELCGKQSPLEAAHLRGQDRRFLIKKAFDVVAKSIHDDVYQVDLNAFALKINQIHSDPNNFHFLCHDCHKKYDAPNSHIQESDFKRGFIVQTTSTKNIVKGKTMTKTQNWLIGTLNSIGKGTFASCYDVVAKNYMKEDKSNIDEAIENYGIKVNGRPYEKSSVVTKRNASCAIFREGMQKEALNLCK